MRLLDKAVNCIRLLFQVSGSGDAMNLSCPGRYRACQFRNSGGEV